MRGVEDGLGVGHVMDGRDHAMLDADPLMDHFHHGGQTVGRTGSSSQ